MLNWWLGKPAGRNRVEDENAELLDAPETPAPVFAARALKSAIFGTPARPDDTIYDDLDRTMPKDDRSSQARSMSPTKPSGILLTPGTAMGRRKTVSFDHEVADQENESKTRVKPSSKSGIPDDCPGKFPSPWIPKSEARKARRRTSLTQALEDARGQKSEKSRLEVRRRSSDSEAAPQPAPKEEIPHTTVSSQSLKPEVDSQDFLKEPTKEAGVDSDMTVDLNEPHSKSGKFWKSEYERYQEDIRVEITKLTNYKNLAKSYAHSKDAQAMNLAVKLKEEQAKVIEMENKISKLSFKIARLGREGRDDDAPVLIKELARQTALAVQYKGQVEEFRVALEENGIEISPQKGASKGETGFASPRTEQTILDTRRELRKARAQLKDMAAFREELQSLHQALSDAKKASTKLEAENTKLTQELLHSDLRLATHLEKCEAKDHQSDEHKLKKDEAIQNLQRDYDQLKEQAKSSRRDAEQLLKKRQEQIVDLRKELASVRGSDFTVKELQQALQKKDLEHAQEVEKYKKQIEDLKRSQETGASFARRLEEKTDNKEDIILPPREWYPPKASPIRESQIPVPASTISRPLKTFSSRSSLHEDSLHTPRPRASHPALSEIINNANVDTLPPQRYGPVQHTPMGPTTPLSDQFPMTVKSPELTMPCFESTQLVEPAKGVHARNCNASPRPSMFNIASSPPKAALMRTHTANGLSRQRSNNDLGSRRLADINSSRLADASRLPALETTKTKVPIPPERVAAAKARLEAKAAEKKKAAEAGKENVKA
ncbi:uncharacterized protein LY89DRAFT_654423 [Mollisia scopiformis]|uniref:Spindle pole body-associated protein cut12 domain-containing protein n=1 Tax=Mollisia scopiformis TaxID=149040 RepID=A0A194WVU2_MOLSC|nr:uncharacterized protein LY89DRAFT_654423 [Mollisia scopiformis]KUJ11702.1 hypothetical protein LY89DRAFT_654423 [Mollisia scopiformis]